MSEFISLRGGLILLLTGVGTFLNLRNPRFGIIAFIILFFSRDTFLMQWFPPIYTILHLPLVFGILILISCFIHGQIRFSVQFWLMVSFFIVICLSRYLAGTEIFGHKVSTEFFKMSIFFFLIINTIRHEKDLNEIIWILVIINFYSTLYHYYHYKIGWGESVFRSMHTQGLDRNGFAALLVSMCPLAYLLLRKSEYTFIKIFSGFCMLSFISGIILTYSRGGALALGITLIVIALQSKQKIKVILILLILGLLIGSRISEKYIYRIKSIKSYEEDVSSMGRVATNKAAENMLKSHPLLGVGAGNFNDLFLSYTPDDLRQWVKPGKSIHNIFLQVASETGLVGLLIFSLLLIKSFINVVKLKKLGLQDKSFESLSYMATGLGIALFGFCVAGQFFPGAYYSYIYIFVPLIDAAKQISHSEVSVEDDVESKEPPKKQGGFLSDMVTNFIVKWQIKRSKRKFDEPEKLPITK